MMMAFNGCFASPSSKIRLLAISAIPITIAAPATIISGPLSEVILLTGIMAKAAIEPASIKLSITLNSDLIVW